MPDRFIIICGHYGCGKTNLALNLALNASGKGEKVTLADLDVVNPYFRSSDYADVLREKGIRVVSPIYAGTNLDTPALSPELYSLFETEGTVIVDVGGDDSGSTALGQFSAKIAALPYDMYCVINRRRSQTTTAREAVQLLYEIESACRLKATALVNNTHLKQLTTPEIILDSVPFARECSALTGLPVAFTTAPEEIAGALAGKIDDLLPVKVLVTTPWESYDKERK